MVAQTKQSIIKPTLDGDAYSVIPGIALELCLESGRQIIVREGVIEDRVQDDTIFKLRLLMVGELEVSVISAKAIQLDGEDWQNVSDFALEKTARGNAWEVLVPVVREGRDLGTRAQSNSLKLVVFEKGGTFSEHTVSVISQLGRFYLVHQVNRDHFQCYRDEDGVFDPKSRSKGAQPKRTQLAGMIEEIFAEDDSVPEWQGGSYQPAPDRSGLTGNQARVMHWTARRGTGAAVLPSGEQVKVYWKNVHKDGLRYLEPGTVATFGQIIPVQNHGSGFRKELKEVKELH